MADVRLTATNPEDSSVVPVACDAAGRLLLEEPQVVEGPPGPPGEQGPPGQDGDPFSGNFADDVTFGGSALFTGDVTVGGDKITLDASAGSAEFTGNVWNYTTNAAQIGKGFSLVATDGGTNPSRNFGFIRTDNVSCGIGQDVNNLGIKIIGNLSNTNMDVEVPGSCTFAGNKAGFTAEGYLWCTTRRGDTVILDATSNGLASWVEYTPTSRIEEIRDKLDANRGDTGEMPADTQ